MKFDFRDIECPVCGTDDSRTVGYRGGDAHHSVLGERTRIVRCRNCTHQYPNPMPYPVGDLDELYGDPKDYFSNHDLEKKKSSALEMVRTLEARTGAKGNLLDIGSGRGELLWAARELGWNAVGVEPSRQFAEFGRKHLNINVEFASLEEARLADDSFDAVVMNGLIEHLYDPISVLTEVRRILRPSGWLYFDAPNEDGLYMTLGNAYMRLQSKDWVVVLAPTFSPFHVQGFNARSLQMALRRSNLHVQSLDIYGRVSKQQGVSSLRKKVEFSASRIVNAIGNWTGRGSYMALWAQKK